MIAPKLTLLGALLVIHPAAAENTAMHATSDIGTLNPKAPGALAHFAFLLGNFNCEATLEISGDSWQTLPATWRGRAILDGYAIADDFKMTSPAGNVIVFGTNFRTYDAATQTWHIKWLNALTGTWSDLAPSPLGPLIISGNTLSYAFQEPTAAHAFSRVAYTIESKTRFTWRGEKSADGKAWRDFMKIICDRQW